MLINGRMHVCKNQREADRIALYQSMGWPL